MTASWWIIQSGFPFNLFFTFHFISSHLIFFLSHKNSFRSFKIFPLYPLWFFDFLIPFVPMWSHVIFLHYFWSLQIPPDPYIETWSYFYIQSNLVIRNFLVTLKLFLSAKCSLSLWSKTANWLQEMVPYTNLFFIKPFLINKFDCTLVSALLAVSV